MKTAIRRGGGAQDLRASAPVSPGLRVSEASPRRASIRRAQFLGAMWKLHTGRLLWNLRWRRRLVAMELRGRPRLAVREIGRCCAALGGAVRAGWALVRAALGVICRPLWTVLRWI